MVSGVWPANEKRRDIFQEISLTPWVELEPVGEVARTGLCDGGRMSLLKMDEISDLQRVDYPYGRVEPSVKSY